MMIYVYTLQGESAGGFNRNPSWEYHTYSKGNHISYVGADHEKIWGNPKEKW